MNVEKHITDYFSQLCTVVRDWYYIQVHCSETVLYCEGPCGRIISSMLMELSHDRLYHNRSCALEDFLRSSGEIRPLFRTIGRTEAVWYVEMGIIKNKV